MPIALVEVRVEPNGYRKLVVVELEGPEEPNSRSPSRGRARSTAAPCARLGWCSC